MSRTGSTSEQSSPTKGRARVRLALVAGLLLTAATTASAGWTVRDVPGTPNDVEVWDATRYSVSTSSGAWLYSTDGGTLASVNGAPSSSTYLVSPGCFASFVSNDAVEMSPAACELNLAGPFGDARLTDAKVKTTDTGAFYAWVHEPQPDNETRTAFGPPGSFGARPWGSQQWLSGTPMTAGVARHGVAEHALAAVGWVRDANLYWLVDGAKVSFEPVATFNDGSLPPKEVQTIDLVSTGRADPTALVGWNNGLYRGDLIRVPNPGIAFQQVPLPGGPGLVTALDVNTGAGTQHGDGFGMATVRRAGGGVSLVRSMPTTQPQDIGTQWVESGPVPSLPTLLSPRYLECQGAKLCVVAQTSANTGNVFVYTNDMAPQLVVGLGQPEPLPFTLPEGASRTVNVRASDMDGDAVRLAVSPGSLSLPNLTLTSTAVSGGVDLTITAGNTCVTVSEPLTITATDGLDEHAVVRNYQLQVLHTLQPTAPVITSDNGTRIPAGSGPQTFRASAQVGPGCTLAEYRWTALSPDAPALTVSPDTASAVFNPPQTLCNPQGETHLYRVEAVDSGGLVSPPTDIAIQVLPWGAPNAPFNPGTEAVVLAGGLDVWLTPSVPTHPCEGSPDFPGVETQWQLVGGQPPPAGVRLLLDRSGTRVSGSSAVTAELGVAADACIDTEFSIDVQHFTRGTQGPAGPTSRVLVHVDKNWNSIGEGSVSLSPTLTTAEAVTGIAGVTGIRCLEQRKDLKLQARLTLKQEGVALRELTVPVPGPWQFPLGVACFGGNYQLEGELLTRSGLLPGESQGAGGSSAVVSEPIFVPPVEKVNLEPIEAAHLTARCGAPATGTLEQRPLAPCAELPVSWEQVGGPPLTQATFTGQQIDVATQESDFGALIGQKVVMRMRARTVQETVLDQELPITVEPFVELQRHTERGTGTDAGLVGVSVELRNTTACGVSEVEHRELLEGVDYQPGSARFNGAPVEAELEGDMLKVKGLVLEGGGSGRLTYVVRPRLLESARFEGQSFLREISLSRSQEDPPAASGCGCSGGGSGLAALGLVGLAAALRRRRAR